MYPVLIDFGVYQLRAYGVVVALAILSGVWVAGREARRKGLGPALVGDAGWPIVVAALAGARLYFVAFHDAASYLARPLDILAVWQGGLSVHGALLGGLLAAVWYARRRGDPPVVAGVVVPQAVSALLVVAAGVAWSRRRGLPAERGLAGAP